VQDFAAAALGSKGKKFKIVPERLLYSQTARRPICIYSSCAIRSSGSIPSLLGELSRHGPTLRDRLRAACPTENGQGGPSAGPHLR
jgi:hypothetical protein